MTKLFGTELQQRVGRTAMRIAGLAGQVLAGPRSLADGVFPTAYLSTVQSTIGGGTSEIMRNVIATRGLGLPRA